MVSALPSIVKTQTPDEQSQKKAGWGQTISQALPFTGLIGGSLAGMGTNFWNNTSLFSKFIKPGNSEGIGSQISQYIWGTNTGTPFQSTSLPDFNIYGRPVLETINTFKQEEIKVNAFVIPFLPIIADVAATTIDKTYHGGMRAGWEEFKSRCVNMPGKKLLTPIIMWKMGVVARDYARSALSSKDSTSILYNFNPSGHVITKTATSIALYHAMETVNSEASKAQKVTAIALATGIVATDAVMMYNTGASFHSAAEMVAGAAITMAIYPIADLLSTGVVWTANQVGSLAAGVFSSLTGSSKEV